MIIGLYGFIGSGKDTVANYLCDKYGFKKVAFADALKDVVASIYAWDRTLLNGDTKESREWREQIDPTRGLSPRQALQLIGTDLFRSKFDTNIWIKAMAYRLESLTTNDENIVITDCRFQNEVDLVKELGGLLVQVVRHTPEWVKDVQENNVKVEDLKGVHPSEYSQLHFKPDLSIYNFGSKEDMYQLIDSTLKLNVHSTK